MLRSLNKRPGRFRLLGYALALAAMVLLGTLGKSVILGAFRSHTESAFLAGECHNRGLWGVPYFSPKAGCLLFAQKIDSKVFRQYLATAINEQDKGQVMAVLGWIGRSDLLPEIRAIAAGNGARSNDAILSAVAIEKAIRFAGENFAEEYYTGYATRVVSLAKREGLLLQDASVQIAKELVAQSSREAGP